MTVIGPAEIQIFANASGFAADLKRQIAPGLRAMSTQFKSAAGDAAQAFGKEFDGVGKDIGDKLNAGISKGLDAAKDAAKLGAIGIAGALGTGIANAVNQDAIVDRLGASLSLPPEEAARLGQVAGSLYADAYGDSFEDVANVLRDAVALELPEDQLEALTAQAFSMGAAFEGAAGEFLGLADQLAEQGVVSSAAEGLDFLTTSFQGLPAQLQEPLSESLREYGTFLTGLGFSTEETFGILSSAAERGEFALDKTGDALKEFQILSTDLSKASVEAYDTIGLSAEDMANRILAGGESSKGAFDEIIDGLLGIDDPATQANTAIALFGAPLEDLGVDQVPAFLQSLSDMGAGFEDVEGAAARLDEQINANFSTSLTSFTRTIGQAFTGFADTLLAPALQAITPHLAEFAGWLEERLPDAAEALGAAIGPIFSQIVEQLSSLDGGGILDSITSAFTAFDWAALFEDLSSAAVTLGPALLDIAGAFGSVGFTGLFALAPVVAAMSPAFAGLATAFAAIIENTPEPVLQAIVVALAAVTAGSRISALAEQSNLIGRLSSGLIRYVRQINFAAIATRLWATAQRLLNLSLLTNPIFLAAAAIAALVGGLVLAYQHSETFREAVSDLVDTFGPVADALKTIGSAFGDLLTGDFTGFVDGIKEGFTALLPALGDVGIEAGKLILNGIATGLENVGLGGVVEFLTTGFNGFAEALDLGRLLDGLQVAFDGVVGAATDLFGAFQSLISGDFSGFVDGIVSAVTGLGGDLSFAGFLAGGALIDGLQGALTAVGLEGVADFIEPVQRKIEEIISGIGAFFEAFASGEAIIGADGFIGIMENLGAALSPIVGIVKDVAGAFTDLFSGDFSGAFDGFVDAFANLGSTLLFTGFILGEALLDGLQSALESVGLGRIADLIAPIRDVFTQGVSGLSAFLESFASGEVLIGVDGFIGAMENLGVALSPVLDIIKEVGSVIGDLFTGDFGGALDGLGTIFTDLIPELLVGVGQALPGLIVELGALLGGALLDLGTSVAGILLDGLEAGLEAIGLGPAIDALAEGDFSAAFDAIGDFIEELPQFILDGLDAVGNLLLDGLEGLLRQIGPDWLAGPLVGGIRFAFNLAVDILRVAWTIIGAVVDAGIELVGHLIDGAIAIWNLDIVQDAFDLVGQGIGLAWDAIKFAVEAGIAFVRDLIADAQTIWDTGILQAAWDNIADAAAQAWDFIVATVEFGVDAVRDVIAAAQAVWDTGALQAIWDAVVDQFEEAWDLISGAVSAGVDSITAIIDNVQALWDTGALQTIWDGVVAAFEEAWTFATEAVEAGVEFIAGLMGEAEDTWETGTIAAIWDALAGAFELAWAGASLVIETAVDLISSFIDKAKENWATITDAFDEAVTLIAEQWTAIETRVTEGVDIIVKLYEAGVTSIVATVDGWKARVTAIVTELKDATIGRVQELWVDVTDRFRVARETVEGIVDGIRQAAIDQFTRLRTTITTIVTRTKEAIERPFREVRDFLSGLFARIKLGAIDVGPVVRPLNAIIRTVDSVLNKIRDIGNARVPSVPGLSSLVSSVGAIFFADGGLATQPSIAGEDGPELILPLTRPARVRALLAQYGDRLAESVGGFDALTDSLFGQSLVSPVNGLATAGPFPDARANSQPVPIAAGSLLGGSVDNSNTTYIFNGYEAREVSERIADDNRARVQRIRVRT